MIDLGTSPPSNSLLLSKDSQQNHFPLRVFVCERCWLVQTEDFHSSLDLFDQNYPYLSGYSSTWQSHCKIFVEKMINDFSLSSNSRIIEVASNDGTLLDFFKQFGTDCLGVEPTPAAAEIARRKGLEVNENFLNLNLSEQITRDFGKANLLIANNVLAHVPDINSFVKACANLLVKDGIASFEFQYLPRLIENHLFDTIYHEHFSYLSLYTVEKIFNVIGLEIFDAEEVPTHGGSLRVFSQLRATGENSKSRRMQTIQDYEKNVGITDLMFYKDLQKVAEDCKRDFLNFIKEQRNKNIVAYGAAAKGNTFLNFVGVTEESICYVVDRNIEKIGKFLPGSLLPIVSEERLNDDRPDYILLLPWNISEELVMQLDYVKQWGGKIFTAVPNLSFYE